MLVVMVTVAVGMVVDNFELGMTGMRLAVGNERVE